MALNPNILKTGTISRGARGSKIDLVTPVNIFNTVRENRREQKLADLTLTQAEKAEKRGIEYQEIMQSSLNPNGTINGEKAIAGLNRGLFFKEAQGVKDRMAKAQAAQMDARIKNQEARRKSQEIQGNMAGAVLKAGSLLEKDAALSLALEEWNTQEMKIPKIFLDGAGYSRDKELALTAMRDSADDFKKGSQAKAIYTTEGIGKLQDGKFSYLNDPETGKRLQREYAEKGYKKTIIDGNIVMVNALDPTDQIVIGKSGEEARKEKAEGRKAKELTFKEKELELKEKESERKEAKFKENAKKWAIDHKKLKAKNQTAINKFSRFSRKARAIANDPNLKYITGIGRYGLGGKGVPLFETKGKDLQADLDNLSAMGAINTMIQLKSESATGSTGFGALSEKELSVLQNALGALENDEISPPKKKAILLEVADIMDKYQDAIESFEDKLEESGESLDLEKTEDELLNEGIDGL